MRAGSFTCLAQVFRSFGICDKYTDFFDFLRWTKKVMDTSLYGTSNYLFIAMASAAQTGDFFDFSKWRREELLKSSARHVNDPARILRDALKDFRSFQRHSFFFSSSTFSWLFENSGKNHVFERVFQTIFLEIHKPCTFCTNKGRA